jgi:predicted nucleic acid-binding protein
MAASVYLETTIPSYLAARRSPEMIMAARQEITRDWWENRRTDFDLFVSQLVWDEVSAGDVDAVGRRITIIQDIATIEVVPGTEDLIDALMRELSLPARAAADAVHIALCVVNGIDYLLTWNCTHNANAANRPIIEAVCDSFGFEAPVICTPEELL